MVVSQVAASQTGRSQVVVEQDRQSRTRSRHLSKPHLTHTRISFLLPTFYPLHHTRRSEKLGKHVRFLPRLTSLLRKRSPPHRGLHPQRLRLEIPTVILFFFFTRAFFFINLLLLRTVIWPRYLVLSTLLYVGHLLRYRCSRLRRVTTPLLLLPEREMISAIL